MNQPTRLRWALKKWLSFFKERVLLEKALLMAKAIYLKENMNFQSKKSLKKIVLFKPKEKKTEITLRILIGANACM